MSSLDQIQNHFCLVYQHQPTLQAFSVGSMEISSMVIPAKLTFPLGYVPYNPCDLR